MTCGLWEASRVSAPALSMQVSWVLHVLLLTTWLWLRELLRWLLGRPGQAPAWAATIFVLLTWDQRTTWDQAVLWNVVVSHVRSTLHFLLDRTSFKPVQQFPLVRVGSRVLKCPAPGEAPGPQNSMEWVDESGQTVLLGCWLCFPWQ